MSKKQAPELVDDLRPEYNLAKMQGGTRGKYLRAAKSGTNLVLIDPDLVTIFPTAEAVNRALRALANAAQAATPHKRRRRV